MTVEDEEEESEDEEPEVPIVSMKQARQALSTLNYYQFASSFCPPDIFNSFQKSFLNYCSNHTKQSKITEYFEKNK